MTLRVLDAANKKDCGAWSEYLESLSSEWRDIHYEPEYMQAYAEEDGSRALCLTGDMGGFLPIMLRGLKIGNAYSYGSYPWFTQYWIDWSQERGVETIRYRAHPFYPVPATGAEPEKLIAYMDLSIDPYAELRKGHASSIMLANKSGVTVELSDDIDLFYSMYCAMLDRTGAKENWRFDVKLLSKLRALYPIGFQVLIAKVDGEPEAGCVLLGARKTCYYHYAGSFGRWRNIGVGNLLVIKAAEYAKAVGYDRLHLGGGLTADPSDSLFRFKAGFSKRRCWVYQYKWEAKVEAA
jgi:GNAT superfamily N-acetyltransferase